KISTVQRGGTVECASRSFTNVLLESVDVHKNATRKTERIGVYVDQARGPGRGHRADLHHHLAETMADVPHYGAVPEQGCGDLARRLPTRPPRQVCQQCSAISTPAGYRHAVDAEPEAAEQRQFDRARWRIPVTDSTKSGLAHRGVHAKEDRESRQTLHAAR